MKTMEERFLDIFNLICGKHFNDDISKAAEQFNKAVQLYATSLSEEKVMEIAMVFDPWAVGKSYTNGEYVTYGINKVGDPQLYKVIQDHISQEDWAPDISVSLFTPIGLDDSGHPVWSQPTGAHDAYNIGDIVNYNGVLYKSLINGNVYSPEEYPAGWEVLNDGT